MKKNGTKPPYIIQKQIIYSINKIPQNELNSVGLLQVHKYNNCSSNNKDFNSAAWVFSQEKESPTMIGWLCLNIPDVHISANLNEEHLNWTGIQCTCHREREEQRDAPHDVILSHIHSRDSTVEHSKHNSQENKTNRTTHFISYFNIQYIQIDIHPWTKHRDSQMSWKVCLNTRVFQSSVGTAGAILK